MPGKVELRVSFAQVLADGEGGGGGVRESMVGGAEIATGSDQGSFLSERGIWGKRRMGGRGSEQIEQEEEK